MDAGPFPSLTVDHRRDLIGGSIGEIGRPASVKARRLERGARQNPSRHPQETGRVRSHHYLGPASGPTDTRLHVHLRPACRRRRNPISEGCRFAQSAAQDEQRVRFLQSAQYARRRPRAGHAEIERVLVGKRVRSAPRSNDGNLQLLGEANEGVGAPGAEDSRAGQNEWPLRVGQ